MLHLEPLRHCLNIYFEGRCKFEKKGGGGGEILKKPEFNKYNLPKDSQRYTQKFIWTLT
jgi:hypothetical protein